MKGKLMYWNNYYLVGLSLSLCIKDIIEGKIKQEDIQYIISGCSGHVFDRAAIYEEYSKSYWKHCPLAATNLVDRMIAQGRIIFAKDDHASPHIAAGHWAVCGRKVEGI